MEIILGKKAGFCFGVENAIKKTNEVLIDNKEIQCLGELVHNKQVIEDLESKGVKFISSLDKVEKSVIIRAHGEPVKTYEYLNKNNIKIYDFTCPMVLQVHKKVKEYSDKNYFVILVGSKKHPESIGSISYCKEETSYLAETKEDLDLAIKKFKNTNLNKIAVFVQTTYNVDLFNEYAKYIKDNIEESIELIVNNTICAETRQRQKETIDISKEVDAMVIIGGKNSSNTKELFNMANKNCTNTFIIETVLDLDLNLFKKFNKVGIMAGASTPKESINEVIEKLKEIK